MTETLVTTRKGDGNGKFSGVPTPDRQLEEKRSRVNLFEIIPGLRRLTKLRSLQFLLMTPNLIIFYIIILAGFVGTPVGNRNIAIVFIWILWWFLLIGIMVPFASRVWCTMCPMPLFGDWFQRRALIKVREGKSKGGLNNQMFGKHRKWPKKLSNIWMQNIGFLALCTFSAHLVTRPVVTAGVLAGITIIATGLAMVYRQRTFCTYLCPVSGFLSLYSMTSMVELRSADPDVCLKCKTKSCRTGNGDGWGCPWFIYMGKLDRNNYCGLCTECLKSCPNDNIALNLRPFGSDSRIKGYDEAWKGFIMLALAMAYSVILLGPNGTVKDWANVAETAHWAGFGMYTAILWVSALVLLPAVFYAFTYITRTLVDARDIPMKSVFLNYAYMLVPLGLLAWIAFSVPLIFINGSYVIAVASDPFGWGWNLFGTANTPWSPLWPEYLGIVQVFLLMFGLYVALKKTYSAGLRLFGRHKAALRGLLPMGVFGIGITMVFMKFFVG